MIVQLQITVSSNELTTSFEILAIKLGFDELQMQRDQW